MVHIPLQTWLTGLTMHFTCRNPQDAINFLRVQNTTKLQYRQLPTYSYYRHTNRGLTLCADGRYVLAVPHDPLTCAVLQQPSIPHIDKAACLYSG